MRRLHRIHAALIFARAVVGAMLSMAFGLLLLAGIIWLIDRSFTGRTATVLTGFVIIWAVIKTLRTIGAMLGPPEPNVKTGTQLEKRRALRRAGMFGSR
jgi:hypothetical protein